ncbi:hypothetical protein [Mucilaginibacter sp.]|nr:hypothetical protein [Mucilaginibacter sp.]
MYSEALGHDFSDEIPEMAALKFHLKEPAAPYEMSTKGNISEADYYKDKYFKLLEKYNEMLEQYNQSLQKNTR